MAFNKEYFSPLASLGSNLPMIWTYKTTEAMTDVRKDGYFPADIGINLGDIIEVVVVNSLTAPTSVTGVYRTYVNQITPTVDVVNGVQITDTDGD